MNEPRFNPDNCIACTVCLVHCPVCAATPEYPGPRFVGPAYERFRLLGLAEDDALHYCSNCKNCDISCPHDVPVSSLLMRARAAHAAKNRRSPGGWILAHGALVARFAGLVPAGLRNAGMNNPATRLLLDCIGISKKAPLPAFAPHTLRALLKKRPTKGAATGKRKKIAFFPGCYIDLYDPQTGLDILWLLEQAGCEVVVPDFSCCGLPMIANGYWEDARGSAAANLTLLARCAAENIPVLTGCPSCRLTLAEELPDYFPELFAKAAPPPVEDAQHFLRACLERGDLPLPEHAPPRRVVYHAPCHLRAQGQGLSGLELLRALPGCDVIHADAGCCGISGSYGFKKDKYEIGMHVGAELFRFLRATAADCAASECGTCRLQILHGSGKAALHPASIVRAALE